MKPWVYTTLYRLRIAPWGTGIRPELRGLVESGRLSAADRPRVLDLGCGTGANAVYLAQQGFTVIGVDFVPVALARARKAAAAAGVTDRCRFVQGDLTAPAIPGVEGPYDVLLDFGALDDMTGAERAAMVRTIHRHSGPGSRFVLWCFYADPEDMPKARFVGASRMHSVLSPGEEKESFGDAFDIERLPVPPPPENCACFLMTRR